MKYLLALLQASCMAATLDLSYPVKYEFDPSCTPEIKESFRRCATTWEAALIGLRFEEGSPFRVKVKIVDTGLMYAGLTGNTIEGDTIVRSSILIDLAYSKSGSIFFSIDDVMTHEIGHALGAPHCDDTGIIDRRTMCPTLQFSGMQATLHLDDINAARALYGQPLTTLDLSVELVKEKRRYYLQSDDRWTHWNGKNFIANAPKIRVTPRRRPQTFTVLCNGVTVVVKLYKMRGKVILERVS